MRTDISIGIFDLIIFLGIIQGLFLAFFFIKKKTPGNRANLIQGLLILFLSLTILEELLNNTGYIVRLLPITDYSEPLNLTFGPLVYLHLKRCLYPDLKEKSWLHFIPAIFWFVYMFFYFVQPDAVKYNSYLNTKHPDWQYLDAVLTVDEDPLGLRNFINQATLIHLLSYIGLTFYTLLQKMRSMKQGIFNTSNNLLRLLRNTLLHYVIIVVIFACTKLYFGMDSDIGSYFIATYISFMFFVTSYHIMNKSDYYEYPNSFLQFPLTKYERSSLNDSDKMRIMNKLQQIMEREKYFKNNLASLTSLAKEINETSHHVSQVINEKQKKNFFEFIASYRIEEAKKILSSNSQITIEELAEEVGYNSKSSFNSAFKKYMQQTPSEFRKKTNTP
ncbi:AraC family transcriptional regulator [Puteibacter caeruleilacunae]|nr:AraC family transcriptional regulator [Puteibacter caeruleilacunae]